MEVESIEEEEFGSLDNNQCYGIRRKEEKK
jgi:hypothetical protein